MLREENVGMGKWSSRLKCEANIMIRFPAVIAISMPTCKSICFLCRIIFSADQACVLYIFIRKE